MNGLLDNILCCKDVSRKSSWTTIQVNVLDDDDLGPEFYHAGCPVLPLKELPCTFGYHVSIPVNFTVSSSFSLPISLCTSLYLWLSVCLSILVCLLVKKSRAEIGDRRVSIFITTFSTEKMSHQMISALH